MEFVFYLVVIVFVLLLLATRIVLKEHGENGLLLLIMYISVFALAFGIFISINAEMYEPKAIDVYRGRTELKIEYTVVGNNTLAGDSIVVFKGKEDIK